MADYPNLCPLTDVVDTHGLVIVTFLHPDHPTKVSASVHHSEDGWYHGLVAYEEDFFEVWYHWPTDELRVNTMEI